ncbi:hypothetical protein GCM10007977_036310 [Dactylosporangium sucinum]|uniref:Uncharacterized protein n=1 Tax=Dactylosporangium sucinum TaxID=1424081 RepID=A0A917WV86_9ACTN|nr:hypothetical protein GCM10007977_036310 [Dactylosporangium sucinum]
MPDKPDVHGVSRHHDCKIDAQGGGGRLPSRKCKHDTRELGTESALSWVQRLTPAGRRRA